MIIVGLGNPSKEYENTPHNLGFMAIDAVADKLGKRVKTAECSSLTCVFSVNSQKIVLAKPTTYMNLSGLAVKSLLSKFNQTTDDLIIIYDDFDIDKFTLRSREVGSAGTHNGMRNIINEISTTQFKRIRIGIGSTDMDKRDFVLSRINQYDQKEYQKTLDFLADALIEYIRTEDFALLMRKTNNLSKQQENT